MEVVVREAEEQKVVGVLGHQVLGDAGRVLVAGAGPGEARPTPGGSAGVDVSVEELVGAPDRVTEVGRRRGSLDESLQPQLMPLASAIDQEWSSRGPDPGVTQPLEDRLRLPAQVVE